MRGHHCEQDISTKVAAFTNYMETTNPNQETPNLSTENVELLTKFATFLQQQKLENRMLGHKDGHWHGKHDHMQGKFGKHGHGGMLGHHFGRHGPYGKHGHGHGHHGHHGHGHGHGKHGRHGFESEKHCEHEKQFGKHHEMNKKFWKHIAMFNKINPDQTIVIEGSACVETGGNPSSPQQVTQVPEGSSEVNNMQCLRERKHGRHGRRCCNHARVIIPAAATEAQRSIQTETIEPPQDLAAMVENITIENSPKE